MRFWPILVVLAAIALIVLPAAAAAPQVLIRYGGSAAQFELTSPQGVRVLIDIFDRAALSRPPTAGDILLTTHSHYDHYNIRFCDTFPGKQLRIKAGTLSVGDVQIKGIPSYHNVSDPELFKFAPADGTNYIFVIETAGLKIVHFGDIGQDAFTTAQLNDLRQVDVALTQFSNIYSDMNINNKLGFKLMEEIRPRLVIPTHKDVVTMLYAASIWEGLSTDSKEVHISREILTDRTRILLMAGEAGFYKGLDLPKVDW